MRSLTRRIIANGENAKKSRGPTSREGKAQSAQNAFRHGLSVSLSNDEEFCVERDALAQTISADSACVATFSVAQEIAEAELDLKRVRQVKEALMSKQNSTPIVSPAKIKKGKKGEANMLLEKIEIIKKSDRPIKNQEALLLKLGNQFSRIVYEPNEKSRADQFADIASELLKIERYEHRAILRRDRAIRKLEDIMTVVPVKN